MVGLAAASILVARPVHAAEDELVLAIEAGGGLLTGGEKTAVAIGGDVGFWLGLSETLWLSGTVGGFRAVGDAPGERTLFELGGGIVAALDVLRIIPFVEASIIGVVGGGGDVSPGARAGIGADYFLNRTTSIGLVVRYRTLSSDLEHDGLASAQLRLGWRLEL
jgi:hypothetical protein